MLSSFILFELCIQQPFLGSVIVKQLQQSQKSSITFFSIYQPQNTKVEDEGAYEKWDNRCKVLGRQPICFKSNFASPTISSAIWINSKTTIWSFRNVVLLFERQFFCHFLIFIFRKYISYLSYFLGGLEESRKFLKALKVITLAESLGGYESLAELPYLMTHASIEEKERVALGVTPNLIRISVGLEDLEDIINDLDQALKAACA